MNRRLSVYLFALGTVMLWGASFPLTKVVMGALGPLAVAFLRWIISALVLFAWLAGRRRLSHAATLVRCEARTVALIALSGITLFYALENLSLRYTTVTNAGILSNLTSVFLALLAAHWLGERLAPSGWIAIGVAFVGAALISLGSGHVDISGTGLIGDLMMVAASLFGALYSLGGKRLTAQYPADVLTAVVAAAGSLFLLPLALWEGLTLVLPADVWGGLLLLGIGSGALANLWWFYILSRTSASRAGMALFLIPVTSTLIAVTALHEPITPAMIAGGALVLGSVAVMQRPAGQEPT